MSVVVFVVMSAVMSAFSCILADMADTIGDLVSRLAMTNIELWHEEDKARVDDDQQVAAAKRNVDKLNQKRNDLIERIDEEVRNLIAAEQDVGTRERRVTKATRATRNRG